MNILPESLFSFEELQKLELKERLPVFFSALDLRPYAKELRSHSPRGADGHCHDIGEQITPLFKSAPEYETLTRTLQRTNERTSVKRCNSRMRVIN